MRRLVRRQKEDAGCNLFGRTGTLPQMTPEEAQILAFSRVLARQAGSAGDSTSSSIRDFDLPRRTLPLFPQQLTAIVRCCEPMLCADFCREHMQQRVCTEAGLT
jgi:hypothetical protein